VSVPVLQHLGALHGFEAVVFYLLVFGPLLALAVTVLVVRRKDAQNDATGSDHS
jgi:hypothetical protein